MDLLPISKNKDYDTLVHLYRDEATTDRMRGRIILTIEAKYMPKIKKKSIGIPEKDLEDYYQIYRKRIIEAIFTWKEKSLFTTYLFMYLLRVKREWLETNAKDSYKFKQVVYVPDFEDMDIEKAEDVYKDLEWGTCTKINKLRGRGIDPDPHGVYDN